MNCPVCGDAMRTIQKHGVEIEVCPGCKGVWLDRGELEKILELEAGGGAGHPRSLHDRREGRDHDGDRHHEGHDGQGHHEGRESGQYGHGHRRRSLLGELFGGFGGDD